MIDPDISRAYTPSSSWYRSDSDFDETLQRVFPPSWQYVADALARHEHILEPACILPESLGEQVVLRYDSNMHTEKSVRVYSNVCTHRGALLITSACSPREIRCPYHGRRFTLDGRCIHMPEFSDVVDFPSKTDHLRELATHRIGPLLFTRIDDANGLPDEVFADIHHRTRGLHLDTCKRDNHADRTFEINAHWALYVENYLEGFHVPFVHAALNSVLDYGSYETHLFPWSVLQVGKAKPGELCFEELEGNIAALYYWFFPNTMVNIYPWGISLNIVEPVSRSKTLVHYRSYVRDAGKREQGAGADLVTVEFEDQAVVESVQKGMLSRNYHRGRYSPTREQGVHHFHRMLFGSHAATQ